MSANNQTLVKKHGDKWYVFPNTNAESWVGSLDEDAPTNEIDIRRGKPFDSREAALVAAHDMENGDWTSEYGVVEEILAKDGAKVKITTSKSKPR